MDVCCLVSFPAFPTNGILIFLGHPPVPRLSPVRGGGDELTLISTPTLPDSRGKSRSAAQRTGMGAEGKAFLTLLVRELRARGTWGCRSHSVTTATRGWTLAATVNGSVEPHWQLGTRRLFQVREPVAV